MTEEPQPRHLPFRIWHPGDPGPVLQRVIEELEVERQREIVGVIIEAEVSMLEARIGGLRKIGELVSSAR